MDSNKIFNNPSPSQLQIADNEVHIWRIPLVQTDLKVEQLEKVLSADERIRAERFYFERDRRSFKISHGLLRILLGQYLAVDADRILFQFNAFGKPSLAEETNAFSMRFNLSHSRGLALLALSSHREVGVDVEYVRSIPDLEEIAVKTFSEREYMMIQALPDGQKIEAFFNCWTRKEAYIKAIGEGLSRPLADFEVSLAPGEAPRLLNVRGHPEELERWSFHAFIPEAGYIAALVVEGIDLQTCYYSC